MWTDVVDAGLRELLGASRPGGGVAVVALGSYARRELCPRSDIDVLLLHDGWRTRDLRRLVRTLCYPLWDAGLSVGHAVHTPRAAAAALGERLDSTTALTDRRLVAGDPGLADALGSRVARWLRRNGGRLLTDLAAAASERHTRDGAHPGMLEPDLKSGPGGLRDLHSLRWAAACVLGETGLDPLVGARYLSAGERRHLALAGGTLLAVRCGLHLALGRAGGDVLRLDAQDDVAARLGVEGGDDLLRQVGIAMRTIAHVHGRAFGTLLADAAGGRRRDKAAPVVLGSGIVLVDGLVEVDPRRSVAADPGIGLRAVAAAAARGTHLGRRTCDRLARDLEDAAPLAWQAPMVDDLLAALGAGEGGLPALRDADHVGLLTALLPEWPRVRGRRQRNPYHRYDLDTHLLVTVAWLHAVARGALAGEHRRLWAGLADPEAVLLAALLHDVGKAWPGDHSEVGARVAERWLAHMGVAAGRRAQVARLVAAHLLLPDAATRRDIDDEAEVVAVAERAGSVQTLDGLYLLSLADGRATGPSASSPWREELLGTLHARARRVLADDAVGASVLDPVAVVAAVREQAAREPAGAVEDMLAGVPRRYLLAATPEQCLAHARLLETLRRTGRPAAAARAASAGGASVLSLAAPDRLGLVADCAGLVAAAGLGVLEARAFTLPAAGAAAVALDWFVVDAPPAGLPAALPARLAAAAAGDVDVAAALAARERRRTPRRPALPRAFGVDVRVERDGEAGRVEVRAPDTPGLLSRLAGTLAAAAIDVTGARVATLGPTVRTVFFTRWGDPRACAPPPGSADCGSSHGDGGPAPVDVPALERALRSAATSTGA